MIIDVANRPFQDYRTFADMHARFALASKDELGYDHTMTKLYPYLPKDERYRVKVGGEYYITTQVLENYARTLHVSAAWWVPRDSTRG